MAGTAKDRILSRLKTIEGHVRGVQRMVEQEAYCIKILAQTLAIQRALDKLNREILEGHLRRCVAEVMEGASEQARTRVIEELPSVFEASAKL